MDRPRSTKSSPLGRGHDVALRSSGVARPLEGNQGADLPSHSSATGADGIVDLHSLLAAEQAPSPNLSLICLACAGNCRPTVAGWCRCTVCGIELPIAQTAEYHHAQ
jgi:hypothetical protein